MCLFVSTDGVHYCDHKCIDKCYYVSVFNRDDFSFNNGVE